MLRSSLCLLFSVVFVSAVFAAPQQGHTDVQSLQYEFGKNVRVDDTPTIIAPVERGCCKPARCCTPVYPACRPACYTPCYAPCYYPVPVYRRACVRPVYYAPYPFGCR